MIVDHSKCLAISMPCLNALTNLFASDSCMVENPEKMTAIPIEMPHWTDLNGACC
jgi:hypothetical protein